MNLTIKLLYFLLAKQVLPNKIVQTKQTYTTEAVQPITS